MQNQEIHDSVTLSRTNKSLAWRCAVALLCSILVGPAACGGGGGDSQMTDPGQGPGNSPDGTADSTSPGSPVRVYPEVPLSCELADMRRWVNANMLDYYLFYDQVITPNLAQYTELDSLVSDLRVAPNDRFSYITDAEQASAQFNQGVLFGFGQLMVVTEDRRVRVSHVFPGSPFASVGIKRGDYLVTINGRDPFALSQQEINDLYGVGGSSASLSFGVQTGAGSVRSYSLTSTNYQVTTVADSRVIAHAGTSVGYLAFTGFLETSRAELDQAFSQFRQQGITELILDLRYNRGGRVSVANKLASMILGAGSRNNTFITVALNDKYNSGNQSIPFNTEPESLTLNRVIVLTTDSSCSASELVINSLQPFMDVVLIGEKTCGKPYGSLGREACDKQMNALEFEFVNASNSGGYYDGISTDCPAVDDLEHALGDPDEAMLDAGLSYVATSSCQVMLASRRKTLPGRSPEPWPYQAPGIGDLTGTRVRQ